MYTWCPLPFAYQDDHYRIMQRGDQKREKLLCILVVVFIVAVECA